MEKRSTEGHMDYEWQNTSGPVDVNSPFLRHAANLQQQAADNNARKRPASVLDSPAKYNTFPSLRDPTPQSSFLFSPPRPPSPAKPLPPTPISRNPAFMTPRTKLEPNYDSSELDNNSSPDINPDSDATPDKMGLRAGMSKPTSSLSQLLNVSPSKKKDVSAANKMNGAPGKGELSRGHYSNAIEKRVRKKRSRTGTRWLSRRKDSSSSDSEAEKEDDRKGTSGPGMMASLFGFIETHPNIPHILSFYAQLLLNVFLVFSIIYIIYCFWSTIRADVDKRSAEAAKDILEEMKVCGQNYVANRCDEKTRVPALETVCNNWAKCAKRDPEAVGRAQVSAHTFAEIFNSFIEPISYKAMIFTLILIFGCIGVSNFAFGFFRSKAQSAANYVPPTPSSYYPQTPYRHPSDTQDAYWSMHQSPMAYPYEQAGGHLKMESPMRRIQY